MPNNKNKLEDLFTDNDEVDSGDLFSLLNPFIKIRNEDGRILFSEEGHRLPVKSKILLFLLGKKVLFLMKKSETEYISPKQIADETKISSGSILPTLMRLKKSYVSVIDGKYFVANHQIVKLKDNNIFSNEKNKATNN